MHIVSCQRELRLCSYIRCFEILFGELNPFFVFLKFLSQHCKQKENNIISSGETLVSFFVYRLETWWMLKKGLLETLQQQKRTDAV